MEIQLIPYEEKYEEILLGMLQADRTSGRLFTRLFRDMQRGASIVCADGQPAGVLLRARSGAVYYRMVFVDPKMRRRGIGCAAFCSEEQAMAADIEKITAFFDLADSGAIAFSDKLGFRRTFECVYMEYTGEKKAVGAVPVRSYRDEDYFEAHRMYAEAFHRMRVQVGDFPDSVPAQPSAEGRAAWLRDAENYLLYEENGDIVGVGHLCDDEISSVSVRVDRQGQGIGGQFVPYLMNTILERGHDAVHLECVVGNPARKLYDRLGFVPLYTQRFVEKKK